MIPVALRYHIGGGFDPVAPYTGSQSLAQNLRGLLQRERIEVHVVFTQAITLKDHSRKEVAELARSAIIGALNSPEQVPLTQHRPIRAAG